MIQLVVVPPPHPNFFGKAHKTVSREELSENNTAARSVRTLWSPAHTSPEKISWFFPLNSPRRTLIAPKSQFYCSIVLYQSIVLKFTQE
jgi:hypothetical protein